jgi:N-acetylmuramic acid 6-phosphate etherase
VDDEARVSQTEQIHPSTGDLDLLTTLDLLHRINDEDRRAAWAVEREIDVIATAVDAIAQRLRAGGKLHYFGAGTSGRIGVLDAAEMFPTFGVRGLVVAHLAGAPQSLMGPVEGAEDDREAGAAQAGGLSAADAAIGISASGAAAYVRGAMEAARARGALTIALTGDGQSPLARSVELPIVLRTGPEVIAGSSRMKAGAAQKMALTMISTTVMVKLGLVYGNLMVGVQAVNRKLRSRAERLISGIARVDALAASAALDRAHGEVKTAIVMLRCACEASEARERLARAHGSLRAVLDA